jgi:hypothetical protein
MFLAFAFINNWPWMRVLYRPDTNCLSTYFCKVDNDSCG